MKTPLMVREHLLTFAVPQKDGTTSFCRARFLVFDPPAGTVLLGDSDGYDPPEQVKRPVRVVMATSLPATENQGLPLERCFREAVRALANMPSPVKEPFELWHHQNGRSFTPPACMWEPLVTRIDLQSDPIKEQPIMSEAAAKLLGVKHGDFCEM